jgi:hypothetical protein
MNAVRFGRGAKVAVGLSVRGPRIRESYGTGDLSEAERYLTRHVATRAGSRPEAHVWSSTACAEVSYEDRQDLVGHRAGAHHDALLGGELSRLIEAANRVSDRPDSRPELVACDG